MILDVAALRKDQDVSLEGAGGFAEAKVVSARNRPGKKAGKRGEAHGRKKEKLRGIPEEAGEDSTSLKAEQITLEDAIKQYEEGIRYYKECSEILQDAQQRIETLTKQG